MTFLYVLGIELLLLLIWFKLSDILIEIRHTNKLLKEQ